MIDVISMYQQISRLGIETCPFVSGQTVLRSSMFDICKSCGVYD